MALAEWKAKANARIASWQIGKKVWRFFLITSIGGLLIGGLSLWAMMSLTYSDGQRAGVVRKLSHKGVIFKTYEGELQPDGTMGMSATGANTAFLFSVRDEKVVQEIQRIIATGNRANLYYKEKYYQFGFLGDTKYFIYKAEEIPR